MSEYTKYKFGVPVSKIQMSIGLLKDQRFMQLKIVKGERKVFIAYEAYKMAIDDLEEAIKQIKEVVTNEK